MERTNISVSGLKLTPDPTMERLVREEVGRWNLEIKSSEKYEHQINCAVELGAMFYGYLSIDLQWQIALYSFLLLHIDDIDIGIEPLDEFSARLCTASPQLHPALERLAEVLGRMPQYYLPYATQSIIISTIQFLSATALEKTLLTPLRTEAVLFPEYKRVRSGIGEAYALFIWDKIRFPDISVYVQAIPYVLCLICATFADIELKIHRDMILILSYVK